MKKYLIILLLCGCASASGKVAVGGDVKGVETGDITGKVLAGVDDSISIKSDVRGGRDVHITNKSDVMMFFFKEFGNVIGKIMKYGLYAIGGLITGLISIIIILITTLSGVIVGSRSKGRYLKNLEISKKDWKEKAIKNGDKKST